MYKKKIHLLSSGDVLAEDIHVNNKLVYKQGTVLALHHIFSLIQMGVRQVKVVEVPNEKKFEKVESTPPFIANQIDEDYYEQWFNKYFELGTNKGRYCSLIQTKEDFSCLQELFKTLLSHPLVPSMLSALKTWDLYSYNHSMDVFIIGTQWLKHMEDQNSIKKIAAGFLLHDIGKIKIPQSILQKRGRLTKKEFEIVKTHVFHGEQILNSAGFPKIICDMAMYHHKTYDNSGYPDTGAIELNLAKEIRILTIVDVFSALTLERPYRHAFSRDKALEILLKEHKKFDPFLLEDFFRFILKMENQEPSLQ